MFAKLQNVVERSVIVLAKQRISRWMRVGFRPQPLASEPKSRLELSQKLAAQEKEMIEAALRESGGRVVRTIRSGCKAGNSSINLRIENYLVEDRQVSL